MERATHPFTPEEAMAYLDGELTPELATAAATHLEHCNECRAVVADLRGVSRQLAGWQVEAAPDGLNESAMRAAAAPTRAVKENDPASRAGQREVRTLVPKRLLLWGGAFAAAALLLLAVSIPMNRSSHMRVEQAPRATGISGPAPGAPKVLLPPAEAERSKAFRSDARAMEMKDRDAKAANADSNSLAKSAGAPVKVPSSSAANGPFIIRRASLGLLTKEFESARAAMENLVKTHQGYFGQLNVATPANAGRSLIAEVRVPAAQLDPVLIELRKLGRVEQENQSADDVTGQYVDLTARLSNARETEKRLVEILRERTGKVSDVLEVEQQIAGVRQQIEQMDAQRKTMENQIQFASVDLRITEEYKQSLETPTPSLGTRIHNAAVDGLLGAADLVISLLLFLLNAGPTLLLWVVMLAWPVQRISRWALRRYRLATASSQSV